MSPNPKQYSGAQRADAGRRQHGCQILDAVDSIGKIDNAGKAHAEDDRRHHDRQGAPAQQRRRTGKQQPSRIRGVQDEPMHFEKGQPMQRNGQQGLVPPPIADLFDGFWQIRSVGYGLQRGAVIGLTGESFRQHGSIHGRPAASRCAPASTIFEIWQNSKANNCFLPAK